MSFLYSRGTDTFDNAPAQMAADSFSDFHKLSLMTGVHVRGLPTYALPSPKVLTMKSLLNI